MSNNAQEDAWKGLMALQTVVNHLMFTRKRYDLFVRGLPDKQRQALYAKMDNIRDALYRERFQKCIKTMRKLKHASWMLYVRPHFELVACRTPNDMFGPNQVKMTFDPETQTLRERHNVVNGVKYVSNADVQAVLCSRPKKTTHYVKTIQEHIRQHQHAFECKWQAVAAHTAWLVKFKKHYDETGRYMDCAKCIFRVRNRILNECTLYITYPHEQCMLRYEMQEVELTLDQATAALQKRSNALAKWLPTVVYATGV